MEGDEIGRRAYSRMKGLRENGEIGKERSGSKGNEAATALAHAHDS